MELEVINIEKEGNSIVIEVLNLQTRELVRITPYQLSCGLLLNGAPVINASATLNDVSININGKVRMIRVNMPENVKRMVRDKIKREKQERKEQVKSKSQIEKERKQAEIAMEVAAYRKREKARKENLKEMTKGFARPGELTEEERRKRRAKYFANKAKAKKQAGGN
jgi:hypothetical protein